MTRIKLDSFNGVQIARVTLDSGRTLFHTIRATDIGEAVTVFDTLAGAEADAGVPLPSVFDHHLPEFLKPRTQSHG